MDDPAKLRQEIEKLKAALLTVAEQDGLMFIVEGKLTVLDNEENEIVSFDIPKDSP